MLDRTDREIIELAAAYYRYEGLRVAAAQDRFGLGHTAFWQRVNQLLDEPAAAIALPIEVARLRRLRDQRSPSRQGRLRAV